MGTENMERQAVARAYDNPLWKRRVNKMPDDQVTAIYLRLKQQGRIK